MMKRFAAVILSLFFVITLFSGCSAENKEYILKYDTANSGVILTENKDGIFYILEEPVDVDSSYGKITVESCYYEDDVGFVADYVLETNKAEEVEKMANDEENSLYAKFHLEGKSLKISSFGYNIREKKTESGLTVFDLTSTYEYKAYPKNLSADMEFLGTSFTLSLSQKQGCSLESSEGKKLLYDSGLI